MPLKLLQPAEVTSAYLKMGLLGFQGSGKTKTATIVGKGLVLMARQLKLDYANKPAAFLDTETGSDWIIPDFKDAGIELVAKKTRSFADLLTVTDEAQAECSLLIIDSLTHFWKELCESYSKRKAADKKASAYRLQFQDWNYLKGRWAEFTDRFVNSPLHIILCGRAGYEYDYFEDDDGAKQLEKTGIKMKAEGEFGFEPSLLVQMELCQKIEGKAVTNIWREAHVLKDRSTLIDGKTFINPTFEHFLPHIRRLNLGGKQLGVDTSRTSEHAISIEKKDWSSTQRKIVLDELQTLLVEFHPSTSVVDKTAKLGLIRKHFHDDEIVWTKIEEVLPLVDLRLAYDSMYRELKGKPSQYAPLFEAKKPLDMNDELPEHSAPPAQPEMTLRQRLCAEIAALPDKGACLTWALETSNKYGDLPTEDSLVVQAALLARQKTLDEAEGAKAAPPKPRRNGKQPELSVVDAG
jgi:hypothetical protein